MTLSFLDDNSALNTSLLFYGNGTTCSSSPDAKKTGHPNTALLSLVLTGGTFLLAFSLKKFRNSQFLGRSVSTVAKGEMHFVYLGMPCWQSACPTPTAPLTLQTGVKSPPFKFQSTGWRLMKMLIGYILGYIGCLPVVNLKWVNAARAQYVRSLSGLITFVVMTLFFKMIMFCTCHRYS